ncbi:hypothetical protein PM3016_3284 [Paenibacillus mucilaginosus 3016]|uniref:Uncharacterized protein n=1 Tax=Paenibacillus mucilaginosus 3016 TaxID=1116391 RepID=H6NHQ8_9BACL|nr:hypothetical protein PM3016_3284 [Paenibacillus mucilaginosus 3016]
MQPLSAVLWGVGGSGFFAVGLQGIEKRLEVDEAGGVGEEPQVSKQPSEKRSSCAYL